MPIVYKIDVLNELKKRGYSTSVLRMENLLPEGTIQSIRERKSITFVTLGKLCKMLNCQPGDIIEYVPE